MINFTITLIVILLILSTSTSTSYTCYNHNKTLPISVYDHQMVYFEELNTVYLFGGCKSVNLCGISTAIYKWNVSDPNSWFEQLPITTPLEDYAESFKSYTDNAVVINNRAYFVGVNDIDFVETLGRIYVFDPQNETFLNYKNYAQSSLIGASGCLGTNDTHIIIVSGDQSAGTWRTRWYIYDINNNVWSSAYDFPDNLFPFTTTTPYKGFRGPYCKLINNVLYIFGGIGGNPLARLDRIYKINMVNQSMSFIGTKSIGSYWGGSAYYNTDIYIVGGQTSTNPTNIIDVFDTKTESIIYTYNMTNSLLGVAALIINQKLFIFGGRTGSGSVISTVQVCDTDITLDPTGNPTNNPTSYPTFIPTSIPSDSPTMIPTTEPTNEPTKDPTLEPTESTYNPTLLPTVQPTSLPTESTYNPTVFENDSFASNRFDKKPILITIMLLFYICNMYNVLHI